MPENGGNRENVSKDSRRNLTMNSEPFWLKKLKEVLNEITANSVQTAGSPHLRHGLPQHINGRLNEN